ncbi:MAG: 3-hydroxyacyl-CoA dehydrogenase NAD-binding domain-containing protein [Pigmentiphaga sp.]|nr:3-hydroxyacyl-CoA dehydrogenase NAD-binding domain-containing protein [Pigmentiphaga sp.]
MPVPFSYPDPSAIRTVAVLGVGSVGASWTALFLARGWQVLAHDPGPGAEARARQFVADAWPALRQLGVARTETPPQEALRFVASAAEAATGADVIQENVPEKPELKASVLAEIDAVAPPLVPILSSTGGIPPSSMQQACRHPGRLVVVHPFNPSHLIPLVEVVGGRQTDPALLEWAMGFARHLGKQPILLHAEASGHMTNRLQFALVREAVQCLLDGVASARDIDAAVRYGLGPRWALMGGLLTLHLAGGPGGMKGILDHAGAAIEQWWTPTAIPTFDDATKARLAAAAEEVADGQEVAEWVRWRDRQLVEVVRLQQASQATEPASRPAASTPGASA